MMYVYKQTEHSPDHDLFTVGYYDPSGKFQPESDHNKSEDAAERVIILNGGWDLQAQVRILKVIEQQQKDLIKLREVVTDLTRTIMELNKRIKKSEH